MSYAFQLGFNVKRIESFIDYNVMRNIDYTDKNEKDKIKKEIDDILNSTYIKHDKTKIELDGNHLYVKYEIGPEYHQIKQNFVQFKTSREIPFYAETNDSCDYIIFHYSGEIEAGSSTEFKKQTDQIIKDVFDEYKSKIDSVRNEIKEKCLRDFDIKNEIHMLNNTKD